MTITTRRGLLVALVCPSLGLVASGIVLLLKEFAVRIRGEAPDIRFLSAEDLVKHLYRNGEGASREMNLNADSLQGFKSVVHGLKCTWLGHARIRIASCLVVFSFLWLCLRVGLRARSNRSLVVE